VPAEIARTLRDALPAYMVPAAIVPLAALPLTASGKVDRQVLRTTELPPAPSAASWQSETEQRVACAWRDVLGHERFSAESNFFEVGGTSLDVSAVACH